MSGIVELLFQIMPCNAIVVLPDLVAETVMQENHLCGLHEVELAIFQSIYVFSRIVPVSEAYSEHRNIL